MKINGVGLGMVTPFTKNDEVDVVGIKKNLEFGLKNGIHSISPVATSGEGSLLSIEEYKKVVNTVVECVDGKVSVTPGASGSTPQAIIDRIKLMMDLGADGAYMSTPPYLKPTQEGLHAHFSKILNSVDFPVVIYNSVHRSAVDMSPIIVEKLQKEHSNFVGYKEPSLMNMAKVMLLTENKLALISEDWLFLPALALGALGVSSVTANVAPKKMVEIYDSFQQGNLQKARKAQIELIPFMEALGIGGGGRETSPATIKAAMNIIGFAAGDPRLPLVSVSAETKSEIKEMLSKFIP